MLDIKMERGNGDAVKAEGTERYRKLTPGFPRQSNTPALIPAALRQKHVISRAPVLLRDRYNIKSHKSEE
ncbi:2345-tetrahydropyridine-26-dicarboxylate N-succinyltransferase, partial [Dissostichus eleginoides]